MIGIYKITSPTKNIYIGQSIDIEKRMNQYRLLHCKGQTIIYNSLLKYGFDAHIFEVLAECNVIELNTKERYYQELYSAMGLNGMNCRLTKSSDKTGYVSKETRDKISKSKKGCVGHRKGKMHSESTKEKISFALSGLFLGYKHTEETKKKMSFSAKGKDKSKDHKDKISLNSARSKIVINIQTGIFYNSLREASIYECIKYDYLKNRLRKKGYKNNTNIEYV